MSDGTLSSASATISVNITAVNDTPTAAGGSFTTTEDTAHSALLSGSDPDGDSLTFSLSSNGSKGAAVITNPATGAFTYTPTENATGSDSFSFRVSDGLANSAAATVNITITAVNDPPVAEALSFTTNEDQVYSGQLSGSDVDGDSLTFSITSNGTKGSVAITDPSSGTFQYLPNENENGEDSFTYSVSDGTATSATVTGSITITPVNDAPTVANISFSTTSDTSYSGTLSATDPDGDNLTYTILDSGDKGTAVVDDPTTGAFTYTPNASATGADSIAFRVNDGSVDSEIGTISITIFDAETIEAVYGDADGANYPGTITDTYTNVNEDINASSESLNTYSWSSALPHKVANTIILKADLTNIPTYATVVDAQLQLYLTASNGETEYPISVHNITGVDPVINQVNGYYAYTNGPWTAVPVGTTYNDIPLGLANIGDAEDSVAVGTQAGYITWQITEMVQQWIKTPSENFGMLLKGVATNIETGRTFGSTDNQNAAYRPRLTIRYLTVTQPPVLLMIEEIKQ